MVTSARRKNAPALDGAIFATELRALMSMPAYERAAVACELIDHARAFQSALAEVRVEAAEELRQAGLTFAEIGELIGCSPQRVNNLLKGHGRPAPAPEVPSRRAPTPLEVRRAGRAEADRAAMVLDELHAAGRMGRPGDSGEWDWWRALATPERRRLSRWTDVGGMRADQMAAIVAERFGLDPSDLEGAMALWLDLTRRVDLGRSVAQGREPDPRRYGGLTARQMFGRGDEPREEVAWAAGLAPAVEGPSPAALSFAEWTAECEACLCALEAEADAEFSSDTGEKAWRRYRELVPVGLDVAGLSPEVIYRRVVAGYRLVSTESAS